MKPLVQRIGACMLACMFALVVGCSGTPALADGSYATTVQTDSNMFHVESCELVVADGKITATIVLPGEGFSRIYFGTAEQAAQASDADIYDYHLNAAGKYEFTVPVSELDHELAVAAWGQRRDRWYDHTITFATPQASTTTNSAEQGSAQSASQVAPSDGEHSIALSLSGGSGRASVESPAKLTVKDGRMTATIVWSSENYDQMLVDGVQYLPINTQGNSTFEIPVSALDTDIAVQAETTAMSEPHMIDYVLRFDSASLQ